MVEDYITDRDQEEALRNWWRENWRWVIGGIVLGIAVLAGWRYYESYRERQAHKAAEAHSQLAAALKNDDAAKASELLKSLSTDFASSAYVQNARLLLAKSHVGAGKFDEAVPLLRAVMQDSADPEMARIARLRLARVLLQQAKQDEVLKLLDAKQAGEFTGAEREVRGDAYYAKGDMEAARAEYAAALTGNDAPIDRTLLEMKLQEVGGVAPAEKADALAIPVGE